MAVSPEHATQIYALRAQGMTHAAIAGDLGLSEGQVSRLLRNGPPAPPWWTPERDAEASRLFLAGWSHSEIAKKISAKSKNAVVGRLTRLGVERSAEVNYANRVANGLRSFVASPKPKASKAVTAPKPKVARTPTPKPGSWREPVTLKLVETAPPAVVEPVAPFEPSAPKPFDERRRTECAWPIDMPDGSMLACCEPMTGQRWCAHHTEIGARKMPPHRRREVRRPAGFDFRIRA